MRIESKFVRVRRNEGMQESLETGNYAGVVEEVKECNLQRKRKKAMNNADELHMAEERKEVRMQSGESEEVI